MRISKLLSAGCALALLMGFFSVRADDTPAQAAARAALVNKMSELDAQQSQPTNAMTASPPATAPTPAAPVTPAGDSGFFTPVPPPSNPNVQVVAPSASSGAAPLTYQWQFLTNQQSSAPPPVVFVPSSAKPAAPAGVPSETTKVAPVKPATPAAVAHKKSKVAPAKPAVPAAAPVVKPAPQPDLNYAGKSLGFKPVEAPPPPVSAQKVAELQALLAKYMANQVSPDEYQKERAAILAEP